MSAETLAKKWEMLDNMGGICITKSDGSTVITKPTGKYAQIFKVNMHKYLRGGEKMNRQELERILIDKKISSDYSLNGGLPNEVFCLNENSGKWEVYYSERGNKSDLKVFDNESDACEYFLREITE